MRRRFGYSMRLQKKTDRVRRSEQQRVRYGASGARESRLRVDSWTNTAHVGRVRDLHAAPVVEGREDMMKTQRHTLLQLQKS